MTKEREREDAWKEGGREGGRTAGRQAEGEGAGPQQFGKGTEGEEGEEGRQGREAGPGKVAHSCQKLRGFLPDSRLTARVGRGRAGSTPSPLDSSGAEGWVWARELCGARGVARLRSPPGGPDVAAALCPRSPAFLGFYLGAHLSPESDFSLKHDLPSEQVVSNSRHPPPNPGDKHRARHSLPRVPV